MALQKYTKEVDLLVAKHINRGCNSLKDCGIVPFFNMKEGDVPGAFMFTWPRCQNYLELKQLMNNNGVDSSVFFGNDAFFIPIHHNLTHMEMDYIINLIKYFDTKYY